MELENAMSLFNIKSLSSISIRELKKRYREFILRYHPDVNKSSDAPIRYREVVSAYREIINAISDNRASRTDFKYIEAFKRKVKNTIKKIKGIIFRYRQYPKNGKYIDQYVMKLSKDELIERYTTSQNKYVRMGAIEALVIKERGKAFPLLKRALEDNAKDVRKLAVRFIGELRIKEAIPYLVNLFNRSGIYMKMEVLSAISLIKSRQAAPFLLKNLFHPDRQIRYYALWVYDNIGLKVPQSYLKILTNDTDSHIKELAKTIAKRHGG